jgi:alpha-galactosidase
MVFNYSNPESRVLLAMLTLTRLRAVGLCHGQWDTLRLISQYLGKPADEIETVGGGINHFFWLQTIRDKATGRDLYPAVREAVACDDNPDHALMRKFVELTGQITYPHNHHVGEYVAFGGQYTGNKWRYGREEHRAGQPLPFEERERRCVALLSETADLAQAAAMSHEAGVPMIAAHALNRRERFLAGNLMNTGLWAPNLLPDGVVEVPVEVDAQGFHPVRIEPLPEMLAAFCRTQMAIQKLTVQAYRERSKALLLQVLLLEPVVNDVRKAEGLIEEMLRLQAEFLPDFH